MRKSMVVALVLAVLPAAAFADGGIGAAAFFNSPYMAGHRVCRDDFQLDRITFGGDLRLRLSILQGEALVLYATGADLHILNIYLDAGVALDVAMLRLSAGAGPNFIYDLDEKGRPARAGQNAKVSADLMLGPLSVGLSYIMDLDLDGGIRVDTGSGLLGAQVLIWQ